MGLFSSKTETYVASTVYNLAGDLKDRQNYIKTLVTQTALSGSSSAGRSIIGGLLRGPNNDQKSLFRWAKTNYDLSKVTGITTTSNLSNTSILKPFIVKTNPLNVIWIHEAQVGFADPDYWADSYLSDNHPELILVDRVVTSNNSTFEINIEFTEKYKDTIPPSITFQASDFNRDSTYIYCKYVEVSPKKPPVHTKTYTVDNLHSLESIPLGEADLVSNEQGTSESISLLGSIKEEIIYNDLRESEVTETPTNETVVKTPETYKYKIKVDDGTGKTNTIKEYSINTYFKKINTLNKTVEEFPEYTKITTTSSEVVEDIYKYTVEEYREDLETYSDIKVFIYRIGSGNPNLDSVIENTNNSVEYFPMLPMRINNRFIDAPELEEEVYPQVKKAFKKGMHSPLNKFLDDLKDNEDIDQMNFIFLIHGTTLNETDNSSKKYIFEYFSRMRQFTKTTKRDHELYIQDLIRKQKEADKANMDDLNNFFGIRKGAKKKEESLPPLPSYNAPEFTFLRMQADSWELRDYNVVTNWLYIDEQVRQGRGKPNAKVGDVWFDFEESKKSNIGATFNVSSYYSQYFKNKKPSFGIFRGNSQVEPGGIVAYYQHRKYSYRRLEVVGLNQFNYVYAGKAVSINAFDGLNDEYESGFVIPLHYGTLKKLNIVDQNQLATCNRLLMINSYKQHKKRWYQRGIFKIFLAIAAVVISVLIMNPTVAANTIGLLGANAAVGATLGFAAGTMASIMAGAVVNAMAAMLLTTVITKASSEILGDKWGALLGTFLSFVGMNVGIQIQATGTFTWDFMSRADSLLNITKAIGQGYNAFANVKMEDMYLELEKMSDTHKEQMREIEQKYNEVLGNSGVVFDYKMFMDMNDGAVYDGKESLDGFMSRTLLTGMDIAEISHNMITDFAYINTQLPELFT